MINKDMWYLESKKILVTEQAGFRKGNNTEDQITYLSQMIEGAFQEKKKVLTLWVDLQKAFDKVWKDGLILKLQRCGIKGKMIRWIESFLFNRRARVTMDSHYSKKIFLRHGVPEG
jgi:hypothetical protein